MARRTATPASRASAIGEGAQYTPLAMRSHEIWRELERETGSTLLVAHGGLVLSSKARTSQCHTDDFFANTVAAAEKYDIAHEILDAGQIRRRFPQFRIADDESGYFEPGAGFVRPEECVRVQLALAAQCGAQLHRGEVATAFDASDSGVTVTTDRDTYSADALIVAAGPWLPGLVDTSLSRHFTIYRQLLCWFDIDGPLDAVPAGEFSGLHLGTAGATAGHLWLSGHRWRPRRPEGRHRKLSSRRPPPNPSSDGCPTPKCARCTTTMSHRTFQG